MSLLDALIDDGLLVAELGDPPKEIWIGIRTDAPIDRLFGSGTIDDPYNGSTAERFDEVMREKAGVGTNSVQDVLLAM